MDQVGRMLCDYSACMLYGHTKYGSTFLGGTYDKGICRPMIYGCITMQVWFLLLFVCLLVLRGCFSCFGLQVQ